MKLTPLDIRHKEFKRGMRGYADVEVDEFLDEIADEYERLFKENIDLQDRVEALEEKVAGYKRIEETLQKTLVNAQASAEEQKQNANKQSQLILQDAELKSRQMVNEAYSERQAIEQSMAKLKSAEEDFRFKFRQLLDGYLRQLQEQPEVKATVEPPAPDFSRHAEAIKEAIARESAPESPETDRGVRARRGLRGRAADGRPRAADAGATVPDARPSRRRAAAAASRRASHREPEAGAGAARRRARGTMSQPARRRGRPRAPPASSARAAGRGRGRRPPRRRERILFGESDDLLSDVDTGVNENEFKW